MAAKRFFIAAVIWLFASSCFAATAGNTSDPKVPYGPGIANMQASGMGPFKVSFDTEWVFDKDLKDKDAVTDSESEGEWHLFRIGYTFADRVEPYVKLGMSRIKTSWTERSRRIKVKGEKGFAAGIGGKVLVYEMPEHKIRLSLDGHYLYTNPDIDKATVDLPNRAVNATEFDVKEWQITGIISMEFPLSYNRRDPAAIYSLIPYLGFAYADSDTNSKFEYSGLTYDLNGAGNDSKFLFITGCDIVAPENASLNIEGKWVGETSGSAGCTLKF